MLLAQIEQAFLMDYRTFPSTYHTAHNKIFALHSKPKLCGRTGKLSPTSKAAMRKRGTEIKYQVLCFPTNMITSLFLFFLNFVGLTFKGLPTS